MKEQYNIQKTFVLKTFGRLIHKNLPIIKHPRTVILKLFILLLVILPLTHCPTHCCSSFQILFSFFFFPIHFKAPERNAARDVEPLTRTIPAVSYPLECFMPHQVSLLSNSRREKTPFLFRATILSGSMKKDAGNGPGGVRG